jgi:hypothetical protein
VVTGFGVTNFLTSGWLSMDIRSSDEKSAMMELVVMKKRRLSLRSQSAIPFRIPNFIRAQM